MMSKESIEVTEEEALDLKVKDEVIASIQHDLGMHREQYIIIENQMMSGLVSARQDLNNALRTLASKYNIEATENNHWNYVASIKAFVKAD